MDELADILSPGTLVGGRFKILATLGAGGMGAVYEAEQQPLQRRVALKVIHTAGGAPRADLVGRFLREARTAAAINHPGIVQVIDFGVDDGRPYLAMERLTGEDLRTRIHRERPLPWQFVLQMGLELCEAIAAAHAAGVIHRDLKPANVFLANVGNRSDVVKVLDFGIAKAHETSAAASDVGVSTKTHEVIGTVHYMSLEQMRASRDVDARTDVYSIGVILYECLAGRIPFDGQTMGEVMARAMSEPPPSLAELRPDLPATVVSVVEAAMAKHVDRRIQTAFALAQCLRALRASEPIPITLDPSPWTYTPPEPRADLSRTSLASADTMISDGGQRGSDARGPMPAKSAPRSDGAAAPDTFTAATKERSAASTRSRRVVLSVVAVGAVATALAAVQFTRGRGDHGGTSNADPRRATEASAGGARSVASEVPRPGVARDSAAVVPGVTQVAHPDAAIGVGSAGDAAAAATSGSETENVNIEATPRGAIASAGRHSCRTPCALRVPAGAVEVAVVASGYLRRTIAITRPLPPVLRVNLEPRPASADGRQPSGIEPMALPP